MIRAVTSGSNIFRRALCPGSETAEAGLPEGGSKDSSRGRRLHRLFKDYWYGKIDPSLTYEEKDLFAVAHAKIIVALVKVFGHIPSDDCIQWELELFAHTDKIATPGHIDILFVVGGKAVIIDLKFGFIEVSPASLNEQLRTYAIAVAQYLNQKEWDSVHCFIIQPFLEDGSNVTWAIYGVKEIEQSIPWLLNIRKKSLKRGAKRIPSEEACRYCKARFTCKEALANMRLMPALREEGKFIAQLPVMLKKVYAARKLIDDIIERAKDAAIKGTWQPESAGFELRPGKQRRVPKSTAAVWAKVQDSISETTFQNCLKVSIHDLEEVWAQVWYLKKNKAKSALENVLGDSIVITRDRPSLVKKGELIND